MECYSTFFEWSKARFNSVFGKSSPKLMIESINWPSQSPCVHVLPVSWLVLPSAAASKSRKYLRAHKVSELQFFTNLLSLLNLLCASLLFMILLKKSPQAACSLTCTHTFCRFPGKRFRATHSATNFLQKIKGVRNY